VAIQGPPPQPYDPLDRHVASLLAMTIPSKRDRKRFEAGPRWKRPRRPVAGGEEPESNPMEKSLQEPEKIESGDGDYHL
jgi:hypothetical protein